MTLSRLLFLLAVGLLVLISCTGDGGGPQAIVPAAPTNVVATPGAGFVEISWSHGGEHVTGFGVHRATVATVGSEAAAGPLQEMQQIAAVGAAERSYRDEDVVPGLSYMYAVSALGSGGTGSAPAAPGSGEPVVPEPDPGTDPGPDPDPDPGPGPDPDPQADPSQSLLLASPETILADGVAASLIAVHLRDAAGLAFEESAGVVAIMSTSGTVGPVQDNGDGTYSASLTSNTEPGVALVSATLNGATLAATATVEFIDPSPPVASIKIGWVRPFAHEGVYYVLLDSSDSASASSVVERVLTPGDDSGHYVGGAAWPGTAIHAYDGPGTYTVSVALTNAAGKSDTAQLDFVIEEDTALWSWDDDSFTLSGYPATQVNLRRTLRTDGEGGLFLAYWACELEFVPPFENCVETDAAHGEIVIDAEGGSFRTVLQPLNPLDYLYDAVRRSEDLYLLGWSDVARFGVDGTGGATGVAPVLSGDYGSIHATTEGDVLVVGRTYDRELCFPVEPDESRQAWCHYSPVTLVSPAFGVEWSTSVNFLATTESPAHPDWDYFDAYLDLQAAAFGDDGTIYVAGAGIAYTRWMAGSVQVLQEDSSFWIAALSPSGEVLWQQSVELYSCPPGHGLATCGGSSLNLLGPDLVLSGNNLYAGVLAWPYSTTHAGIYNGAILFALDADDGETLWREEHYAAQSWVENGFLVALEHGDALFGLQTNNVVSFPEIWPLPGGRDHLALRRYGSAIGHTWSHGVELARCTPWLGGVDVVDGFIYALEYQYSIEALFGPPDVCPDGRGEDGLMLPVLRRIPLGP